MKKLLVFTLVVGIISFIGMIFNFLASTDIFHEYVGTYIRERGIIAHADKLPMFTQCKMEWSILQIDYFVRLTFMILMTIVLITLIRKEK